MKLKDFTNRRGDPISIDVLKDKYDPQVLRIKSKFKAIEASDKWAEKLPIEGKDALGFWAGNGYRDIRRYQRGETTEFNPKIIATQHKNFRNSINKAPQYEGHVFRGIAINEWRLEKFKKELDTGYIRNAADASGSMEKSVALDFASKQERVGKNILDIKENITCY